MGGLGVLVPFKTKTAVDFFSSLEMYMRQHLSPLCGRDHLAFRGYYHPVKGVIDGDLCEQFSFLEWETQKTIAEGLVEEDPSVVAKRMEKIRTLVL